jgi:hypothetical protein
MGQDGEDSLDLENLKTQKVPDKVAAGLIQEIEAEVRDSDPPAAVKGATHAALVPPPAQLPLTDMEDEDVPEPPEASFEIESDSPAGGPEWVRWAIIVGSVVGIFALGFGAWASYVKIRDSDSTPATEDKHAKAQVEPEPRQDGSGKAQSKHAAPETKQAQDPTEPSKAVAPEPKPIAPEEDADAAPEEVDAEEADPLTEVDAAAIAKAIKRRKIRGLDNLLVSYASKKRRSFANAEAYCKNLDVAGVSGWRLPEIGELFVLSRVRFVRRYTYWSKTLGDTYGDRRLTWNARRRRIRPLSPRWRGGRAVCVRSRP